ncbi:MAG: hypothetical protein WCV79_01245 [Candidatus Paceibacterota bacterium]
MPVIIMVRTIIIGLEQDMFLHRNELLQFGHSDPLIHEADLPLHGFLKMDVSHRQ